MEDDAQTRWEDFLEAFFGVVGEFLSHEKSAVGGDVVFARGGTARHVSLKKHDWLLWNELATGDFEADRHHFPVVP